MPGKGFKRMDVGQAKSAKKYMETQATSLEGLLRKLAQETRDVEWEGPDAKKFKGTELQKIEASVKKVVKEITNMANTLDRNIKRQEQVSSH